MQNITQTTTPNEIRTGLNGRSGMFTEKKTHSNRTPRTVNAPWLRAGRLLPLLLGMLAGTPLTHADTWTVKGKLEVLHQLDRLETLYDDDDDGDAASPLRGIEVKVSGRSDLGWWNSWGTTFTDAVTGNGVVDGSFSVSENVNASSRHIKVEVRFRNDDLTIRDAEYLAVDSARWYKVYEGEHSSRSVDVGTLRFDSSGSYDLDNEEAREQADYWVLASLIMDTMADLGYPFLDELVIEHGWHNPFSDQSYCNPFDGVVHIEENDFSSGTVIHEVMHRWLYDHMNGETALSTEILQKNQTHCTQDSGDSWVAFVEGFSEFCEDKLAEIMFGDGPALPFNHDTLHAPGWEGCGDTFNSTDGLELSCFGWVALFSLITTYNVAGYDFNGAGDYVDPVEVSLIGYYDDPRLDFDAVLRAITGGPSTGQLDKDDMNFEDFLSLVVEENYHAELVTADTIDAWLKLLDPIYSFDSWDLFDFDPIEIPGLPNLPGPR